MTTNVRLQNLRNCTVQICHVYTYAVVGAGTIISSDGKLITCAGVVRATDIELQTDTVSAVEPNVSTTEIPIYFPYVRYGEPKARFATILGSLPDGERDIVVLQLLGTPILLAPEQIAVLGKAEKSSGHWFSTYTFAPNERALPLVGNGHVSVVEASSDSRRVPAKNTLLQLYLSHSYSGVDGAAVLDVKRNLIVGVAVSAPDSAHHITAPRDNSTANLPDTAWATNAHIVSNAPWKLYVRDATVHQRSGIRPRINMSAAWAMAAERPGIALFGTPPLPPEWVGRETLIQSMNEDWARVEYRATSLVGPAGIGKSALARLWVSHVLADDSLPVPDGIFWWNFHTQSNIDAFFSALVAFLSGQRVYAHPHYASSTSVYVQTIGAMLAKGRYLFVLDGIDVLLTQSGDNYGLLNNTNLREFLEHIVLGKHMSFCLLTSRIPVLDLIDCASYVHREIGWFHAAESQSLLSQMGVWGEDTAIEHLATTCHHHPLMLCLAGAYLIEHYEGKANADTLDFSPALMAREAEDYRNLLDMQQTHLWDMMTCYDAYLSHEERTALVFLSLFRRPVHVQAIADLLRLDPDLIEQSSDIPNLFYRSLLILDDQSFEAVFNRLLAYRLLHYDTEECSFTLIPLVQQFYRACLAGEGPGAWWNLDTTQIQDLHERIEQYYLRAAENMGTTATLEYMLVLTEAVYHARCAGAYNEAWRIYWEQIARQHVFFIGKQLGAYQTALELLQGFFTNSDTTLAPLVTDPMHQKCFYEDIGLCLSHLERLDEAIAWYERIHAIAHEHAHWNEVLPSYNRLIATYVDLGMLDTAATAARQALELARQVGNERDEMLALAHQAWVAHIRGYCTMANATFCWAEVLERSVHPGTEFLYSLRGIWHAEHLQRTHSLAYARKVAEANLARSESGRWRDELSRCYRVLGDIEAEEGNAEKAYWYYNEAVETARDIPHGQNVLIEALLARSLWLIHTVVPKKEPEQELPDTFTKEHTTSPSQQTEKRKRVRIVQLDETYQTPIDDTSQQEDSPPTSSPMPEQEESHISLQSGESGSTETTQEPTRGKAGLTEVRVTGDKRRLIVKYLGVSGSTYGKQFQRTGSQTQKPSETNRPPSDIDKPAKKNVQASAKRSKREALQTAQRDLEEAFRYAYIGKYACYEADVRIGLAWVYLAKGEHDAAKLEATYAQGISMRMGYYWGRVNAEKVLARVER